MEWHSPLRSDDLIFAPSILAFGSKIEKTVRANRKETKLQKKQLRVVRTQSNPPPEIELENEVESRVNENPTQTLESEKVEVDSPEEVPNTKSIGTESWLSSSKSMSANVLAKLPVAISLPTTKAISS
ncbi:hypothetical protein PVK06_012722 [Gossypium arboreum]|uniref:Uncharacterized protein n=1 Tax=Gossypium arboreum TaxID=29729 RepID=A0ABR0QDA1_GOSAR|nr:hypothetical protein PVK06_012722 [Gossypium arboreum]